MTRPLLIAIGLACALVTAAGIMRYNNSLEHTPEKTTILKGIKTITEFYYKAIADNKWEETPTLTIRKYDVAGKIVEECIGEPQDIADNYYTKTTYEYDESNNLIEEIYFDGHGRQQHKEILEYESNKLIKKVSYPDWSGGRWEDTFDYYKDGRLRSEDTFVYNHITTDAKTLSKRRVTYTYKFDEKNNLVEQGESYEFEYPEKKSKTKIAQTLHYKYDNLGRKIEEISYNESGKIHEKFVDNGSSFPQLIAKICFQYDNNGNIIETSNYSVENKLLSREKNDYDNQGKLIQTNFSWTSLNIGGTDDKELPSGKITYQYEFYPAKEKK